SRHSENLCDEIFRRKPHRSGGAEIRVAPHRTVRAVAFGVAYAILFLARPEVAGGKSHENGRPSCPRTFPLKRSPYGLDGVPLSPCRRVRKALIQSAFAFNLHVVR